MNVTILSVDIKTMPTQKGSYQKAEVAYKNNTFQGKVEGKSVMSFGATAATFKVLQGAQSGQTYEVEVVKNAAGYLDWVGMTSASITDPTAPQAATQGNGTINKTALAAPTKSTYETSQERAEKQVYIVRQSSLSAAINTLSLGAKKLEPAAVMLLAQSYVDFVFGVAPKGPTGFEDLPDFPADEFPDVS
ncbi:MAG: hypothetical protein WAV48_04810 [Candidatus Magasanikiibacteriota bacterium]